MQRQRYTVIGTKNGYNVKDFIMAYSETEAKLIYKRSRPDVEVTECYITKANDWHGEASMEIHSQLMRRKIDFKQEEEQPKGKLMTFNIKCKYGWVGSDE